VAALLGRTPAMTQAVLQDHHRYRIVGRVYPGMRPKPGSSVLGIIMEITPREAVIFDLFEDADYDKQVRADFESPISGCKCDLYDACLHNPDTISTCTKRIL
jgi:Gamma-glutamyl cyclotransferase, AIG2-like